MMNLLGNKSFTQVLLNDKGEATDSPKTDPQAINPDQGMIDASKELIKAIEKKDATRIARCFRAMMTLCDDDMEDEDDESSEY